MDEEIGSFGNPGYNYEYFKAQILRLTGIDLNSYKEKQMKRRIITLIGRKGFQGYEEYVSSLEASPAELAYFIGYITINVTDFFRTPEQWNCFVQEALREKILQKGPDLKIWSCACATGEEAYSLVMNLAELLPLEQISVTATDLDEQVLSQAEKGIFSAKSMENVPEKMKEKYFMQSGGSWEISDAVKSCVSFRRLDLLKDPYPQEQDIIVCRNVLIYFTEEAKNRIYHNFFTSLTEGGCLFTGNTEQIIQSRKFGFTKIKNFLYCKNSQNVTGGGPGI